MNKASGAPSAPLQDADLARRREEIRRGLVRSNAAAAVALLVSLGLALAAGFYAFEAWQANERTRVELWNSQLAQARALRLSGKVGRRQESLATLAQAVSVRASPELRDEAIATLALVDIQPGLLTGAATPHVNAYSLSPRFACFGLGYLNGEVAVFDASNGEARLRFDHPRQPVSSVGFSPDERFVSARWDSGRFEVWDIEQRRRVFADSWPQREASSQPAGFHPDGQRLAVACADNCVRIVNLREGRSEAEFALDRRPWVAVFDNKGDRLAVGAGRWVEILAYPTGQKLKSIETVDTVGRLQWHPGGRFLAAGSPLGRVTLMEASSGKIKTVEAHTQRIINLLFHPQGSLLVTASWDGTTRFWDAGAARLLLETTAGYALGFDASGERLGYFREGRGVGDWRMDLEPLHATVSVPFYSDGEVLAIDLSSDGRWLAGTTADSVRLWDCVRGWELDVLKWPRSWGVAFTSDDQALLLSSETGLFRAPLLRASGEDGLRLGLPQRLPGAPPGSYSHGAVSAGKQRWFCAEGSPAHVFVDLSPPHAVRVLPGRRDNSAPSTVGTRWASTSRWKGGGTRIWDLETAQPVKALPDEGGVSRFSPDGRRLVVGASDRFLFYDTQTWTVEREVARDSASAISGLAAFSPDGRCLAVTHGLREVRLLSPDSGAALATLSAPKPERITALAFSGDGSVLAGATDNAGIQIWRLRDLRRRLETLHLDWDSSGPAGDASPAVRGAEPVGSGASAAAPRARLHRRGALWIAGTGSVLALVLGLTGVRHHRRLVRAYEEVEAIARKRRQELEAAQAQLIHSQKMKALGALAAGVAHDFNNLLSVIRMSNQLLARQVEPSQENREELEAIEQAVNQGKGIARSILGYSRQAEPAESLFCVSDLVSETLAMLSQGFLSGIILTLELDPEAPLVRGERSRIEQILLNLVVNASEAMQGQGRLTLTVRQADEPGRCLLAPRPARHYVELAVRDSGPGISEAHLPHIFEPFFSTRQGGAERGAGLGLTTVYSIAERDGWGLDVITQPGAGATFRVLIPADPDAAAPAPEPSMEDPRP